MTQPRLPGLVYRDLGSGWRLQDSELSHQAHRVHNDTGILDAAIFQAIDDNPPHPHRSSSWGNPEKFSLVRSRPVKATGDFIILGNLLLNEKGNIRKASTHGSDNVLQTVQSGTLARQGNLLDHIFPGVLRSRFDVSLRNDFVCKCPDDACVILCHSSSLRSAKLNYKHSSSPSLHLGECTMTAQLASG